jgi:hypothetical protein
MLKEKLKQTGNNTMKYFKLNLSHLIYTIFFTVIIIAFYEFGYQHAKAAISNWDN